MCYILQCVKIQNTADFTMRPEFASPMAYIMSGPRSIVQRIVDIAKVVILHLKSVLSFLGWIQHRGQKNDPAVFFVTHFSRDIYLREENKNNVLLFFKKLCTFIVLFWVLYSMFQSWIKIVGVENVTYEQIHHRINKHLWFYSLYTDQVVNVVNIFR